MKLLETRIYFMSIPHDLVVVVTGKEHVGISNGSKGCMCVSLAIGHVTTTTATAAAVLLASIIQPPSRGALLLRGLLDGSSSYGVCLTGQ